MSVSVVLLVNNRKEYYKEALASLKTQTDKDFELVIVSNIKIEYDLSEFKDVNIIASPDSILDAYITGLNNSKNEIVAFMDDDDKFVSNKISILKGEVINGYYHNDFYDFGSKESHNNGKGFNASCIAVNRKEYMNIVELSKNQKLKYIPDSIIYWYALENNLDIIIDNRKLTYYRHKSNENKYKNLKQNLQNFIISLLEAQNVFKIQEVKDIIREGLIQNKIYLNTLGIFNKISIGDLIWLLNRPIIEKKSKIISYILTMRIWQGMGIKVIEKMRNRKVIEKMRNRKVVVK